MMFAILFSLVGLLGLSVFHIAGGFKSASFRRNLANHALYTP